MQYVAVFVFMHMHVFLCAYVCALCTFTPAEGTSGTLKYLWHIQAENTNQIFIFPAQFPHKMLTLVFHPQSLPSPFSILLNLG